MANSRQLASDLGEALQARGESVATAESCTGGMIAAAITDIPGSSGWFSHGVVSYGNQAKQQLLKVQASSLMDHGAVSERVVREMAAGAQALAGADWAVAVSGIAGPDGGSPEKPVGLVWLAIAHPGGQTEAWSRHFSGDRHAVRQQTMEEALARLLERVHGQAAQA
ncbi:CinA family protein [Chromobacterium violaceum]|uniref:Damage-inducible protein CinA n=2 Tax=Chromobacterium violaceum TaxID=536 RepID=A0A1R0MII1_CHRVL|nr:nicotinamide-nucleotide amidohydrolase family protein [Chromobacterium violaceum]AAQ60042.1 cinA-related protein [Chromobacterium violaceum ATCC 12472]ATP28842.1 damage-inducible protein CinA [Chromobacterium violaceum]ATP32754.1 damage-inducible protein CinA [Chromobacterium violaceum]KJH66440.1 damage-inducible protein CinA [Chromobacterium violaceum]KMN48712.1 damage-inducible protein CinA [Chromobacterium violaceum]